MENEIPNPGRLGRHDLENEVKIMKEKFGESEK
jgi:hypothetical protein